MTVESQPNVDRPPTELIDAVLAEIVGMDGPLPPEVDAAMRLVPRHVFTPGASLTEAYTEDVVRYQHDEHGVTLSSVSSPRIIAMMLRQLRVRPGDRVLEVGSGGYNAALLAELVGPTGTVVSVDIDPEVVDRARACLAKAGYGRVPVVCADGGGGLADHGQFDRIIVTVEASDIPPAWIDQLTPGGRLVVPLRMRGMTRSIAFEPDGDRLVSREYELCGFVPMRGARANRQRRVPLGGDEVGLLLDQGHQVNADLIGDALSEPRVEQRPGITLGLYERFDGLQLWIATRAHGMGILTDTDTALDRGLLPRTRMFGSPVIVDGDSIAYLGLRPTSPRRRRFELGTYAHGSDAIQLAARMIEHVRSWDGTSVNANIQVYPADTSDHDLPPGFVIDQPHSRITITWPPPGDG